jgi:hydrogenase-1 operon protein HyaF
VDRVEAGPFPGAILDAWAAAPVAVPATPAIAAGLMNGAALLHEVLDQARSLRPGDPAHVVNLSLLPVNDADLAYLQAGLGDGPVDILSRGYGNCRIRSTAVPRVWWVQFFNSMDQIILNTIEVVDLPEVALAAAQDYEDSCQRLAEWLHTLEADAA